MRVREKIKELFSNKRTFTQKYNLLLTYIQFKARKLYLHSYPISLRIDPCNYCNLHCVLCPVGTKAQGRKQSKMDFIAFKNIMDECGPYIWDVDLFNWGEPLLNKDIFKMIEYARKKKIDVTISTNLNYFDDDMCLNIIKSGLNKLIVSLDGASQESVSQYQKGCNFQKVIENIKKVVNMKEQLKSSLPFVQWRFLINRYNENEIDKAKEISKELRVDKLEIGNFRCDMGNEILLNNKAQYENVKDWLPENETLSMYNYSRKQKKDMNDICRFLWFESTIQPDGAVSPCCAVWHEKYDFGNINESSFKKVWNSKKYQDARRISRGDDISIKKHICFVCKLNRSQI